MDIFPSVGGLSSIAAWPILMNLNSLIAYFPAAERYIAQINLEDRLHSFLGTWTGFLLATIISGLFIIHSSYSILRLVCALFLSSWHVRCSVPEGTVHYLRIMEWVSAQPDFQSTALIKTPRDNQQNDEIKDGIDFSDGMDSIEIKCQMPGIDSYRPAVEKVRFWRNGAYFWMEETKGKMLSIWGDYVPDNTLEIYCFSWNNSNKPIRDFLDSVNEKHLAQKSMDTAIYRSRVSDRETSRWFWSVLRYRTKRPLKTVIMDRLQKETVVNDIRAFLSREGVRWYREKGHPIRLGYLFHGPPGTGKSSFAFALAGHFGLPIYILNLSEPKITDSVVEDLFTALPFHCIIMLEDIDATKPLKRDDPEDSDSDSDVDVDTNQTPAAKSKNKKAAKKMKNSVTLSGLLNAIDGIGASEGRILIMSTNNMEALDEALIRAGRADRIIAFTNVTKKQARDMFVAAYTGARWVTQQRRLPPHDTYTPPTLAPERPPDVEEEEKEDWGEEDIAGLAEEFSDRIRDQEFSPALLQQFFKDFRAEPRRAVQEVDVWMENPRAYRKPLLLV